MELEPNSLDSNGNELKHELELEDMKSGDVPFAFASIYRKVGSTRPSCFEAHAGLYERDF